MFITVQPPCMYAGPLPMGYSVSGYSWVLTADHPVYHAPPQMWHLPFIQPAKGCLYCLDGTPAAADPTRWPPSTAMLQVRLCRRPLLALESLLDGIAPAPAVGCRC